MPFTHSHFPIVFDLDQNAIYLQKRINFKKIRSNGYFYLFGYKIKFVVLFVLHVLQNVADSRYNSNFN